MIMARARWRHRTSTPAFSALSVTALFALGTILAAVLQDWLSTDGDKASVRKFGDPPGAFCRGFLAAGCALRGRRAPRAKTAVAATEEPAKGDQEDALAALLEAEEEDDRLRAMAVASGEEAAETIAAQAASAETEDPEIDMNREELEREMLMSTAPKPEIEPSYVVPPTPVYDFPSLCEKYGGVEQVYKDHLALVDAGFADNESLQVLKDWLFEDVAKQNTIARKSFVEFEHTGRGSRLVLVGTDHLSKASARFAKEVVEGVRPECLVVERQLGDDSLQRFTVPEKIYSDIAMGKAPSQLLTTDTPVERVNKFAMDKTWLVSTPGWKNIGGEASWCQEFGEAFTAFAQQRTRPLEEGGAGGPLGGTLCMGDVDLRSIRPKDELESLLPLSVREGMVTSGSMALRDLQMSRALRAALQTHKSVVGVVGRAHMEGIFQLLQQDPRIRKVKAGTPLGKPEWLKELKNGGKQWERECMSGNMFARLAEVYRKTPYGTFFSAGAVEKLYQMREETAERLLKDGPSIAEPAAPISSELGDALFKERLAYTPSDDEALQRWLAGEDVEAQEGGVFPYENKALRRKLKQLASG